MQSKLSTMKKITTLFFVILLSLNALAQLEVKPNSFKLVEGFVNIDPDYQYDDNNLPYAVLKIKTENINDKERHNLSFETPKGTFFEIDYHIGEVWLFISYYTSYIKFSYPDSETIKFEFPFEMQGKKGYEITVVNTANLGLGSGSITVTTKPEDDAYVIIDGKDIRERTPYTNPIISAGKHEITVSKFSFEDVTKTVDIKTDEHLDLEIEMPYIYGEIHIETTPPGATVIVDDSIYCVTPVTLNNIVIGNHWVKLKKDNLKMISKKLQFEKDMPLVLNETFEQCPEGAINSVFSVSATEQVYFSKGNLQYQTKTNTWRFADNQYYFIGPKKKDKNGCIDNFAWNTWDNPTLKSTKSSDYKQEFTDWGHNPISNGGNKSDFWRTLSSKEWDYVTTNRKTESGIRFAKATINGICGVVLLPDNWKKEYFDLKKTNDEYSNYNENAISLFDWINKLEAHGAVFLPSAGYRKTIDAIDIGEPICLYWSSSIGRVDDDFWVYNFSVGFGMSMDPSTGMSVRLVH